MSTRLQLFQLSANYQLDKQSAQALHRLAGLDAQPAGLHSLVLRGTLLLAAALAGLGLLMWMAANWPDLGRAGRFGLLQTGLLLSVIGAAWLPKARSALALLALLILGGLLAFFGQTYQTGADTWQLFALWAALALPLCLGARSDALWLPWAAIGLLAIALWMETHLGSHWGRHRSPVDEALTVRALALAAASLLLFVLGPWCRRLTGAGPFALRGTAAMVTVFVTAVALSGLDRAAFGPHYWLGLMMLLAAVVVLLSQRGAIDLVLLSSVGLGLNVLLVFGFAHWLQPGSGPLSNDPFKLLLVGAAAALLLAGSVSGIMRVANRRSAQTAHSA